MIRKDVLGYPDRLSMVNENGSEWFGSFGIGIEKNTESYNHCTSCEISEVSVVSDMENIVPTYLEDSGHPPLLDLGTQSWTERASIANEEKQGVSVDLARDIILGLIKIIVDERSREPDVDHNISAGNMSLCIPEGIIKNNVSLCSDHIQITTNGKLEETLSNQTELAHSEYNNSCSNPIEEDSIINKNRRLSEDYSPFMKDPIGKESIELSELKSEQHSDVTLGVIENLSISGNQDISLSVCEQTFREYISQNYGAPQREIEPEELVSWDLIDGFPSPSIIMPEYSGNDVKETKKTNIIDENSREIRALHIEMQLVREKLEKEIKQGLRLQTVVDDYENTMTKMIEDTKKLKEDYQVSYLGLLIEKNESDANLVKAELAFNDLNRRYEDLKALHEKCLEVSQCPGSKRFAHSSNTFSLCYRTLAERILGPRRPRHRVCLFRVKIPW